MSSFAEYTKKKKKEKNIVNMSFKDYTSSVLGISFDDIAPIGKDKDERREEDIAPVRGDHGGGSTRRESGVTTYSKNAEEKERTWFQKGEFEDGYQFGDLTKTILGSKTDLATNVSAGIIGMGEKAVDVLAYLAPAFSASQQAQNNPYYQFDIKEYKQQQKDMSEFIQKDLYDEQEIAKSIISDPYKKVTGIDSETASVFGAKSDSLAQSAGQLGATIGLQAVGVPWWLTTGATSFGGEAETALKEGATYEQAGGSALITAGADILTEKISGGIKFGGKTLDDGLTKVLARKISDKTLRTFTKLGVDATGEGFEEVLAGAISNLGTSLYKEENLEELLFSEEAMDEYIESFIGGAVLGGGMGGINAVRSNSKGVDYVTEMTENEQKVHDAEVKRRTEEAEAEKGEKLTGKEKKSIYEQVTEDLERGHIDTSNIESVLGGETYETYNSIVEQEKAINEEIKALENKVESTFTHKDSERLAELREQLKTIDKQSVQERLSAEVEEMTRTDRLHESYNERSRRGQAFEADLTQYAEGVQRDTVKSAVESGILNNTNRTHEFVDLVAKLSADKGVLFDFTDNAKLKETGFALEGRTVNGYVQDGKIAVNINSSKALNTVVGHEITHVLEGTELYSQLQQAVTQYAKTKGEYDSRLEAITKLYKGVENANIDNELTADLVGEYLFTDKDFINNLSTEKPNLFQKIFDEVKYLVKVATAGSKEARELAKVKRLFEQAYKETSKAKPTDSIDYHVSNEFSNEIDKVLNGEVSSQNQVKARDYTPQILVDNGVSDLPMLITQKHIKSIIYTEAEAKQLGLPINDKTHYHGLGKDLLIRAIDSMDNPSEIYKKDADHYIFITELTDADGHTIIVPVKVDGKGTYNDVYIDENQIQSVYGKKNLDAYLARNGFEKVGMKKGTALNEGDQFPNISNSSDTSVPQNSKKSSGEVTYSLSEDSEVPLSDRLTGDALLDAEDLIAEIESVAEVSPNGYVTLYHRTTAENAKKIMESGKMSAKEDGIFFSTKMDGENSVDYGDGVVKLKVPVEKLMLDDIFSDEAHLRIPLKSRNEVLDVSSYLMSEDTKSASYSLSEDNEGHTLSDAQREYFKDSKAVNENGELVVVYHGTRKADFTVFNRSHTYFTDSKEMADSYAPTGEKFSGYLNIKKPFVIDAQGEKWSKVPIDKATKDMLDQYGGSTFKEGGKWRSTPADIVSVIEDGIDEGEFDYDGVIIRNVDDTGEYWKDGEKHLATDYIVFNSNQFKNIDNATPTDNPDINLSLSDASQDIAPVGNYRVYGKDVALEAPMQETVTEVADDYAPLTEEMANERDAQQGDRLYSLDDADAPAEVEEAPYLESEPVKPEDPFAERDIQDVGKKNVKAYMYENPEVRPYFQEEAKIMLRELSDSIKGEKHFNDQLYYDTNGELGWFGTKRETSEQIAYLLDRFKYTYADIRKGLEAIIEDHGAENIAVAKRLEFMIDERLRDGYTDFLSGYDIPANQEYLTLMQEKQISDYSDEAFEMWARSLSDEHAPAEDIAPVREDIITTNEKQQVMDFEKGEIVDEEETEARKTHGEIQKAYVDAIKNRFAKAGFDFDRVLEHAKNLSTFASVDNTPQRFIEKTLGYKEGQILSEMTIEQEALNESAGIKWLNSFTNRKGGKLAQLSKKYGIKPNSKADASAQMYGEGFYVNEAGEYITYGDAELAKDFPDVEMQKKIKALAKDPLVRQIYDETLEQINASRMRNGYPEIPRRKDYFLHFRAMDDTFSRLGIPFNPNDIKAKDLPTDINGMTADLKPGQPYFASAMQRRGNRTSHSLLGGMERYLTSAKNQIYHIDDIQTLRGLRNYVADMYGQAHGLEGLNELTEEEAEARIKEVYDSHLSNFAKFLNEQANTLAGKTSLIDRGLEGVIGRRGISTLNTINTQVAKNMVGFNISSSLTNFVGAVQGLAKVNKFDAIKAFSQVAYNKMTGIFGKTDGFAENDPGIIRRKGAEKFYRTPWEKVSDKGYILMSAVDDVTSEFLIRAKYNELTRKGMNSEKAHIEADKWAMRILGDRSLGQQPQLYNSKMLGLVTKFQLEVRNQLDSMFYDTVQEANVSTEDIQNGLARNAKKSAKIASTMVQLAVFQHLFGKGFEAVAGYNPTFDIISVLMTLVGYDDDEESEDTLLDNAEQAFLELLGDLPYTSTLTGGRVPIQSALPITELIKGEDSYGNEKSRWETLAETAPYYLMPGGYNQIKKTTAGLKMFDEELPVAGSYTDSGNLRFPIEDTPLNRIQAGIFGQWASENARDYFDNERKPLKERQIEEYAELDLPIADYWEYREGLAEQETLEDKFDYIAGLDLPVEKKNIMINNVVDRKEEVDLENYDDFEDYEEFDFAVKNPEKYPVVKAVGGYDSYKKYTSALSDITADKDENGKTISGSRKKKVTNYINGLDAEYGAKIILYKSEYPADDTYNQEIIDYLNSREDITYADMEGILKALGFTVEADGTVRW